MQTDLPFHGISPLARHCSYQGAQHARPRAGSQCATILNVLAPVAMTRHDLASATRIAETTLCARIATLKRHGLVQEAGSVIGPFGVRNVQYRRAT